jgi:mannose-6-phosphate isomerase-like protein (cupin superfamily)
MNPVIGTELINPHVGTRTVFTATAASTGGEYVEVEATYPPNSTPPPKHLHPSQTEHFTVRSGRMHGLCGEAEFTLDAGDQLVVPAGTPHQMWAGEDGAVMTWRTSPALRTGEMFCDLWVLARDNDWQPDPMQLFEVISRYDAEFCLC